MKKLKIIGTNQDNLETIFHLNGVNEKIYFKITQMQTLEKWILTV